MRFNIIDTFANETNYIEDIATGEYHTIFLSNNKDIYTCGINNDGQLGTVDTAIKWRSEPTAIGGNKCIDKIYAGNNTSFASTLNHEGFAWGNNSGLQLGLSDNSGSSQLIPSLIQKEGIIDIVPAHDSTFFIDSCNNVYVIGSNTGGQFGFGNKDPVETIEKIPTILKIQQLSAGHQHALFLTKDSNQVFVCGSNTFGQLGIGNNQEKLILTELVFPNIKIIKVIAGLNQSFFITDKYNVYACGVNRDGQLGTGNENDSLYPIPLSFNEDIVDIVSNYTHTFFISKEGAIYGCGNNGNGQLGLGNTVSKSAPTKVTFFDKLPVKKVCTGALHTVYLLENGTVYASGANNKGTLGLGTGNTTQSNSPTLCSIAFSTSTTGTQFSVITDGNQESSSEVIDKCIVSKPELDCATYNLVTGSLIRRRFVLNSRRSSWGASTNVENMDRYFNNTSIPSTEITFVDNFNIPNDNFIAFEYTGWIVVDTTGMYTFGLTSDDGSDFAVFLNGNWSVITNAYGYKGPERSPPKPGDINLISNVHYPIRIRFHEHGGGQALNVFWIPPDKNYYTRVPFSIFRSQPNAVVLSENFPNPAVKSKPQATISLRGRNKRIQY